MSINTPIPFGPHHESIHDPRLNLYLTAPGLLLNYCPRHAVGSMFMEGTERWTMIGPISPLDFLKRMESQGLELPSEALEKWLATIHRIEHQIGGGHEH